MRVIFTQIILNIFFFSMCPLLQICQRSSSSSSRLLSTRRCLKNQRNSRKEGRRRSREEETRTCLTPWRPCPSTTHRLSHRVTAPTSKRETDGTGAMRVMIWGQFWGVNEGTYSCLIVKPWLCPICICLRGACYSSQLSIPSPSFTWSTLKKGIALCSHHRSPLQSPLTTCLSTILSYMQHRWA